MLNEKRIKFFVAETNTFLKEYSEGLVEISTGHREYSIIYNDLIIWAISTQIGMLNFQLLKWKWRTFVKLTSCIRLKWVKEVYVKQAFKYFYIFESIIFRDSFGRMSFVRWIRSKSVRSSGREARAWKMSCEFSNRAKLLLPTSNPRFLFSKWIE